MRAVGVALTTAALLVVPLAGAPAATPPDSPLCRPRTAPPQVGLTPVSTTVVSSRTTLYAFRSAAVGSAMPDGLVRVRVTLPVGYADGAADYPVLVHLHGANNSPTTWPAADVEQVMGDTPVIFVQPDGGPFGNYVDWYGTPVGGISPTDDPVPFPPPAWETFHIREVLPWVDATFRTTGHRAVAGSSLGGFGSMSYPARNPGVFDAAASLSGGLDRDVLAPAYPLVSEVVGPCILGDRLLQRANWAAHNPTDLVPRLRGTSLYLTVGDGLPGRHEDLVTVVRDAPLEILVRQTATNFVAALQRNGVPATVEFRHGTHPSPAGVNREYDFDGLRAFLRQAMAVMGAG